MGVAHRSARMRGNPHVKPALSPARPESIDRLTDQGKPGIKEIASMFGIHRSTVFRLPGQRQSPTITR